MYPFMIPVIDTLASSKRWDLTTAIPDLLRGSLESYALGAGAQLTSSLNRFT